MIVRYWHPFQEVETLRRQLDQVFEDVTNAVEAAPHGWTPAVRLVESGDYYVLTAQLAGVAPDAIDIQVTREAVTIAGERQTPAPTEGDRVLHDDVRYGSFRREVTLPAAIRNDAVQAEFAHGVLTLTLPKVEELRSKVVKINLGQGSDAQPAIAATEANGTSVNA